MNLTRYTPLLSPIIHVTLLITPSRLDLTDYRVPHSKLIVSLEGIPPYGSPVPKDNLIPALASASAAANEAIRQSGDKAVPGL